jgi:hypothetical protein
MRVLGAIARFHEKCEALEGQRVQRIVDGRTGHAALICAVGVRRARARVGTLRRAQAARSRLSTTIATRRGPEIPRMGHAVVVAAPVPSVRDSFRDPHPARVRVSHIRSHGLGRD